MKLAALFGALAVGTLAGLASKSVKDLTYWDK